MTRINKDNLRQVIQASYKQLLQESLNLATTDLEELSHKFWELDVLPKGLDDLLSGLRIDRSQLT